MRLRFAWLITGATFAILYFVKGGGWPTIAQLGFWVGASLFVGTLTWLGSKGRAHGEEVGRRFAERHRETVHSWLDGKK
jgi:hypothetical protein